MVVMAAAATAADIAPYSAGLRVGPLMGRTDYTDEVAGGAQVFARYQLQEALALEALAGYGRLSGSDFATDLVLIGLEALYTIPIEGRWQPLVRTGVTGIRHDIAEYPAVRSGNAESIAWSAAMPVGLGLRRVLSHRMALELTGTYTYTLRDDLDNRTDPKGNDWLFSAGVALVFARRDAPACGPPGGGDAPGRQRRGRSTQPGGRLRGDVQPEPVRRGRRLGRRRLRQLSGRAQSGPGGRRRRRHR